MCRMCEGTSRQQLHEEARLHIIHHGWFLQGVLPEPGDPAGGWVYTVGLLESFDHPELVITNIAYERGGEILNALGELIREGHDVRDMTEEDGMMAVRQVHPRHFDHDLVNTFEPLQGRAPAAGDYLQVVPDAYCRCHQHQVADLSSPAPFERRLNRAQRRAAARRKGRPS